MINLKEARKKARDWLINSPLTPFEAVIKEAKITPEQEQYIRLRFVEGKSIVMIGIMLNISPDAVKLEIGKAYDNINKVIEELP